MSAAAVVTRRASFPRAAVALLAITTVAGAPLRAQATLASDSTMQAMRLIGMSVAASGGPRDTLGLLVASVTRDGPADQAGITTGSRVLTVNGQAVRLVPAEIGQRLAADSAIVRFVRAVRGGARGSDVTLRVAGGGLTRTVVLPATATREPVTPSAAAVLPPAKAAVITPVPAPSTEPVAAPAPSPAVAVPVVETARTVPQLADTLGALQLELRRIARASHSLALGDSLAAIEWELGALRRRLQALGTDSMRATPVRADAPPVRNDTAEVIARWTGSAARTASAALPRSQAPAATVVTKPADAAITPVAPVTPSVMRGAEFAPVSGDLATYLGAAAASALLVVRADESAEPLRAGDVLLQVDGAPPDAARLRAALAANTRTTLQVLRRGRTFVITLGEATDR